jgi:hypothetical protein
MIKALAVLDGAFVVALDGTVVAACRYRVERRTPGLRGDASTWCR